MLSRKRFTPSRSTIFSTSAAAGKYVVDAQAVVLGWSGRAGRRSRGYRRPVSSVKIGMSSPASAIMCVSTWSSAPSDEAKATRPAKRAAASARTSSAVASPSSASDGGRRSPAGSSGHLGWSDAGESAARHGGPCRARSRCVSTALVVQGVVRDVVRADVVPHALVVPRPPAGRA